MYRVFVDQKVIEFSENINNRGVDNSSLISSYSSLPQLSELFIDFLHSNDKTSLIVLTAGRFDEARKSFRHLFHRVKAAGGIVRNLKGDCLFIKRHGLWDLPKGKLEKGESHEAGAIREVQEETGLQQLEITNQADTTLHIYTDMKGSFILKETFWYEMLHKGEETPVPQQEEDITEVRWFRMNEVDEACNNTYRSLREMLVAYFAS